MKSFFRGRYLGSFASSFYHPVIITSSIVLLDQMAVALDGTAFRHSVSRCHGRHMTHTKTTR